MATTTTGRRGRWQRQRRRGGRGRGTRQRGGLECGRRVESRRARNETRPGGGHRASHKAHEPHARWPTKQRTRCSGAPHWKRPQGNSGPASRAHPTHASSHIPPLPLQVPLSWRCPLFLRQGGREGGENAPDCLAKTSQPPACPTNAQPRSFNCTARKQQHTWRHRRQTGTTTPLCAARTQKRRRPDPKTTAHGEVKKNEKMASGMD